MSNNFLGNDYWDMFIDSKERKIREMGLENKYNLLKNLRKSTPNDYVVIDSAWAATYGVAFNKGEHIKITGITGI